MSIFGQESIKQAYGTGKGGVVIRAVAEIEEDKKGNQAIVITEIPYQVNRATLVDKIADILTKQRVVNERNIKSIHKAEDFVRESVKNLKAAQAELYRANTEEKG